MDDLISRQEAIDALCRRCDLVAEDDEPCTEKCNDIKILEKLPSADTLNLQPTCNQLATDCISRQAAIDALETIGYDFSDSGLSEIELAEVCEAVGDVRQDMIRMIKRLPPAQPEIIRCKDCMHNGRFDTDCPIHWNGKEYCSFAERRNDE